ncbi:MAG: APC family permease [Candidatus Dormiibacterota bacterium]
MNNPPTTQDSAPTQLATNQVTLFGDVVAGITNVAPSTAIALTLGAILSVSGLAAPFVIIMVGILMLFIAIAYNLLNRWQPSAAAQAQWLARSIRPLAGLIVGFAVILMALTSNISNITLFGPYLLGIINSNLTTNAPLEWLCSAAATGIVMYIAIQGIRRAIRFQSIIVWLEYALMLSFGIALLVAEFTHHPGTRVPNLAWLLPTKAPSYSGILNGAVLGVFSFGGWEASVYLAEEGTNTKVNPGRASIISVLFCIVWFTFMIMAIDAVAPVKVLVAHSANIIAYAAGVLWPRPFAILVSLAVLSSVVAVTQSQLNNFSRMTYGLSRDALLPKWFAHLSRHRTPSYALMLSGLIPVVLLIIYLSNTSAGKAIGLISGTAGFLYIVIYVAGAVACIWYYRRVLTSHVGTLILAGILPFIGGAALVYIAIAAIPTTPLGTLIPFLVMFVGIFPVAWLVMSHSHAPFFSIPTTDASQDAAAPDITPAPPRP